jgi:hypothetical protein
MSGFIYRLPETLCTFTANNRLLGSYWLFNNRNWFTPFGESVPISWLVWSDHRALSQILGGRRANRNFVAEDRCCEIARPLQACLVCAWLNVRVQARRSVAVVTLHQLHGTPETAGLDACSVCSNWRVAVAATHRERKPYWFACHFDPHRPYHLSF